MVALRKELDLVWVWFYKEVAPTALFKGANPAKEKTRTTICCPRL